jgi:hypothetical protein
MQFSFELLLAVFVAAAVGALFAVRRRRAGRKDPELRRRELIERRGRLIEGSVIDYHDGWLVYTWSWRGVDYQASQDVRQFLDRLPAAAESLTGPVTVKFLTDNPANSIVISENWNGFRIG